VQGNMARVSGGRICVCLTTSAANAQDTVRVRGTIERLEGPVYIVKSRDGSDLKVSLAENGGVTAVVKAALAEDHSSASRACRKLIVVYGRSKSSSSRNQCAASGRSLCMGSSPPEHDDQRQR
jgi:hypothetical protein